MHFESVAIESLDYVLPETVLTSDALEAELNGIPDATHVPIIGQT